MTTFPLQASSLERKEAPPQYEDGASNFQQHSHQFSSSQDPFQDSNAPQTLNSSSGGSTDIGNSQGAIYEENKFGEMQPASSRTGDGFGADTDAKSEAYAENRFGELGRADTFEDEPRKRDKLLGMAEQVIGKVTHNQELHDKGVARKSPPRA